MDVHRSKAGTRVAGFLPYTAHRAMRDAIRENMASFTGPRIKDAADIAFRRMLYHAEAMTALEEAGA